MKKPKILKTKDVFKGKKLRLHVADLNTGDGKIQKRECVVPNGAVAMVALFDDHSILLNRQYRYAGDQFFWEIPAGTLDDGEAPRTCARRELIEETGYMPGRLKRLTKFYPSPGYTSEIIHIFVATNLHKVDDQPIGHKEEGIRNKILPLDKALSMISTGKIIDGKTIIGLLLAKEYLLETEK